MQKLPSFGLSMIAAGILMLSACVGTTQEAQSTPVPKSDLAVGGMMYDNWMKVVGADTPASDPPLWTTQTTNTRSGADAWRCKECHGWDYKGVDGAYGSGSHMTGFKGVMGAPTMSDEDLEAWLDGTKNPDHDFSTYIPEENRKQLVEFLKKGVTDTAQYINADKTVNGGDPEHGKELFTSVCEECHGEDGKKFNFGSESEPEYIGTIAADNPWEFWHKVSFSQPGETMPSGLDNGWRSQDFVDVLSYAQTLPGE